MDWFSASKLIGWCFTVQRDDDPQITQVKHLTSIQWNLLFTSWRKRCRKKPSRTSRSWKICQSMTTEETLHLITSMHSRLIVESHDWIYDCPITFHLPKNGRGCTKTIAFLSPCGRFGCNYPQSCVRPPKITITVSSSSYLWPWLYTGFPFAMNIKILLSANMHAVLRPVKKKKKKHGLVWNPRTWMHNHIGTKSEHPAQADKVVGRNYQPPWYGHLFLHSTYQLHSSVLFPPSELWEVKIRAQQTLLPQYDMQTLCFAFLPLWFRRYWPLYYQFICVYSYPQWIRLVLDTRATLGTPFPIEDASPHTY